MRFLQNNILKGTALLSSIVLVTTLIWSSNKGLDLSDESFYLLAYLYPGELKYVSKFYPLLVRDLFGFMDTTIINLRILRLILTVGSSTFLGWAAFCWLKRFKPVFTKERLDLATIIFIAITAGFLSYSWIPQTPSYNSFSLIVLQLICGNILWQTSFPDYGWKHYLINIWTGLLAASLIMIKFPNFILVIPLVAGAYLFKGYQRKRKLKFLKPGMDLIVLSFGVILFFLFRFGTVNDLMEWKEGFFYKISTQSQHAHSIDMILEKYWNDALRTLRIGFVYNLWLIIPIASGIILGRKYLLKKRHFETLSILLIIAAAGYSFLRGYYHGGADFKYDMMLYYTFLGGIVFALLIANHFTGKKVKIKLDREKAFIASILLSMPFSGALGTNNGLSAQLMIYMPFFFLLIYLVLQYLSPLLSRIGVATLMAVTLIIGSAQTISGVVFHPYRLNVPLTECNYSLKDIYPENILVDEKTGETISQVINTVQNKTDYQSGDPVFTFRHETGFVYLLRGKLPVFQWYMPQYPKVNCQTIAKSEEKNLEKTIFILRESIDLGEKFKTCLPESGIPFPHEYSLLKKVDYLYEGGNNKLLIYVPEKP